MEMKKFKKFMESGLWLQPIVMTEMIYYFRENAPPVLADEKNWKFCLLLSFVPSVLIWSKTLGKPDAESAIQGKQEAMYPKISPKLLYKKPTGIVLGRDKRTKRYVCKALEEDGHIFLIGGSGSGKSSAYVIPALLVNQSVRVFAVDIKGELSFKTAKYGDEHVHIFNPSDRSGYGYDALYGLTETSSTQQIMETMQTIAFSLVPLSAVKDPFWKISARNLLLGLLIYYYKQGIRDLVSLVDEILGKPVKESIQLVMTQSPSSSIEYRYIVQFNDMAEETLGGIVAEMNNHLVVFSNDQDVRYAFRDNPCKLNPRNLEEGYSIYLSIREEKLSAYYDVMQLIINQTLSQLEKRPEDSEPIIFTIDELPRILSAGKIDRLLDAARTLRSRNVCLFLITQSTEALMSAFTENEVADLISNCPYIVVLSASSRKTQQAVCAWCGKYKVKKTSWSGGPDRRTTVSFEEKDIMEPSELMTLKNTGEAIIITPQGYCRVKKVPYYSDKFLKPLADEIIRYNKAVCNMDTKKDTVKNIERSSKSYEKQKSKS